MVDPSMTPEDAQLLMESMGLDKPVWVQYVIYLKNMATGHMGLSFHYGEPVIDILMNRLPNTILLFTTSIILSALLGVFLGRIAAWKQGERTDTMDDHRCPFLPHPVSSLAGLDHDLVFCLPGWLVSHHRDGFAPRCGSTPMPVF
jgi:ABC-type antimicrobial peptide transport system permease subunit